MSGKSKYRQQRRQTERKSLNEQLFSEFELALREMCRRAREEKAA